MKTNKKTLKLSLLVLFLFGGLLIPNNQYSGANIIIVNAACVDIGAGDDGHCFGDIEFACLHSNYTSDCNIKMSKNPPHVE